ncbi:hypothetical protein GCM10010992_20090 [Cloacibacterium rupense]|uniref:HTH luxR-type domain-containing protein n=1 Tax=Cloacibacterium rupense TaxID=517423 RepID=A0ABQ2NJR3_9FLAO|nr:hypothetical protein [Cloacibacterium rupense]GGP05128.1 hypothetical protein GCM10010992_20090 [Cloacibacterium rupense]
MSIKINWIFSVFAISLIVSFSYGQTPKKELDSLFENNVKSLFLKGEYEQSLALCKKVIAGYEELNDKESTLKAYLYAANICSNIYRIQESLHYLDLASVYTNDIDNPRLLSKLNACYSRNFYYLGYKKNAIIYIDKAINNLIDNSDKYKKELQYYYGVKALIYEDENNIKELYHNLKLSHKAYPDVYSSARLARYFINFNKNLDSAKYYLDFGDQLNSTGKFPIYQKSILKRNWGRYYLEKKQYQDAVINFEESLAILKNLKKNQDIKDAYKLLYEAYKKQNNDKKASLYLEKYSHLNDSIKIINQKLQEIPLHKFLKEKEIYVEKKSNRKIYFIVFAFVLFSLLAWVFYRKRVKVFLQDKQKTKIETDVLKLKINDSFQELVKLAKENAPEFFAKFKETYPRVVVKILEINPSLRVSELTLCAYIFLGFNAKDIARYTHKSINTIRNRKYNLRKKLNLSEEVDISLWFRNFDNEKND